MGFSVAAAAKPGDDGRLQVGHWADDAPAMQRVKVVHGTFRVMFVGCLVDLRIAIAVCCFGFIHR